MTTATTETLREWIAQHEAGHAAARVLLGLPFARVVLAGPDHSSHVMTLPGAQVAGGPALLAMACGCIAEWQMRGLEIDGRELYALLRGGPDDVFALRSAATGQVACRPSRASAVAPGGDLHEAARLAAGQDWNPGTCLLTFWRPCEEFAAAIRPAIDAVAAALLERGELPCADVAEVATAAMEGKTLAAIPGWALQAA